MIPSAPNKVAREIITPQHRTNSCSLWVQLREVRPFKQTDALRWIGSTPAWLEDCKDLKENVSGYGCMSTVYASYRWTSQWNLGDTGLSKSTMQLKHGRISKVGLSLEIPMSRKNACAESRLCRGGTTMYTTNVRQLSVRITKMIPLWLQWFGAVMHTTTHMPNCDTVVDTTSHSV